MRSITHDTPNQIEADAEKPLFGSDVIAQALRDLEIPFLALNPGASFRGLHDSLVNHLGNQSPQMLLVLHEESAVAIAHGFAKATGRTMGAVLHSNVGLMHASMAIFNAWCDRVPMMLLGATGPVDAARRRPWIDWLHTSADQGAIVRDYTKWDDQPASVPAAVEALARARLIATTAPYGPTYVNLDAAIQEAEVGGKPPLRNVSRALPPPAVHPSPELVRQAAQMLSQASNPVMLVGRVGRDEKAWAARVALAEALDMPVICDLKTGATFPTAHPLLVSAPGFFLTPEACEIVRSADVVVSLDWIDLGGTLRQCCGGEETAAKVLQISLDQHLHRGWNMEYFGLAPTDAYLLCDPDVATPLLLEQVERRPARDRAFEAMREARAHGLDDHGPLTMKQLAEALDVAIGETPVCFARLPLGWNGGYRNWSHPLDYLGYDGGAGIGSGPGMAVGTALGLIDTGRTTIAVLGDGDFLMGVTAIWTAVHYGIPLLIVVANNRSFYNDETHQEKVAIQRGRNVENKWIGQAISGPDIDIAAMARAQGAIGIGPVSSGIELKTCLEDALDIVKGGGVVVVDARVQPGYSSNMSGTTAAHKR
ncbi:thiamine pyrophosphate-binding protein [Novosphingobium guangzhouense]|uniref:Acetolactate synthase n=1 Tax=Novosphingobium guangzhouense TaxID=1850347 RepID=A0A2K2FWJ9_9SPHN|nr:thiamine pyrophosphate-dependent enzyme [Novosphingobium guangzhouense]PNU03155.1 acetolactate synthase [Novosphingobium guangzhouense]